MTIATHMKTLLQIIFTTATLVPLIEAAESSDPLKLEGSGSYQGAYASQAIGNCINAFGLALHQRLAEAGGNTVTSPWSIETTLAMTFAGADGQTKAEMGKVLHLPPDEKLMHDGFASLSASLESDAGEIFTANRLYGQQGKAFKQAFLETLEKSYRAPLEALPFATDPDGSRRKINSWVEKQTQDHIKDLIPTDGFTTDTQLVLCNAVHFKAPWTKHQKFAETPDFEFAVHDHKKTKVTGLLTVSELGYQKIPGGVAVTVPYEETPEHYELRKKLYDARKSFVIPNGDTALQFVLLVPDAAVDLVDLEKQLTPEVLASLAKAERKLVMLQFPKFKLQPATANLTDYLVKMGMPSAFNQQGKSADFSRMADDSLFLSAVFHKAFITVDKNGTEAAAATAAVATKGEGLGNPSQPIEVRVDRPFAFAIQHTNSGACLFLGRVIDPR